MIKIVADKICKTYKTNKGSIQVLDKFSLTIQKGEIVALMGPNGCGKSTLLEVVGGLMTPDSGDIKLDSAKPREVCEDVAIVFQKYALFTWLTVIGNLKIVLEAKNIPRAEWDPRCMKYLEMFDLIKCKNMYPTQLSGGMQQKLAIARALIGEPKLLLLDEPFAALDAVTRRQLKTILIDIIRDSQKTVLFVTHNISEAIVMANRIIIVTQCPGQVLESIELSGTPSINRIYTKEFLLVQTKIWNLLTPQTMS